MKEKIAKILESIECENKDNIDENTLLSDIEEWDSMGKISIITMISENYGYILTYEELKKLKTIGDIVEFMEKR